MSPRTSHTHAAALRAVIYTRLSSHRGDVDPSTSPARQVQTCRAYAEAKGWTIATHIGDEGVIADLDVSGSDKGLRLNRPGLATARQATGQARTAAGGAWRRVDAGAPR